MVESLHFLLLTSYLRSQGHPIIPYLLIGKAKRRYHTVWNGTPSLEADAIIVIDGISTCGSSSGAEITLSRFVVRWNAERRQHHKVTAIVPF